MDIDSVILSLQVTMDRSPTDAELTLLANGVDITTTIRRGRGVPPKEFRAATQPCEVHRVVRCHSEQTSRDALDRSHT